MDARLDEIRRTFTDHPQRAGHILARLRHTGADLDHLTEMDLAEDPRSGFTDQNHVGGRALAVALGARLGLRRDDPSRPTELPRRRAGEPPGERDRAAIRPYFSFGSSGSGGSDLK